MVEFEASEAESALAVQLSALTTYIMNMAGSYKKDMLSVKAVVERLQKENQKLKEKLTLEKPMEKVRPEEEPIPAPTEIHTDSDRLN